MKTIPLRDISLKQLSVKMVTLLAILSGQRVQTLSSLKLSCVKISSDRCVFYIDSLLKTSKPGKHKSSLEFLSYDDSDICIVRHVQLYIEKTKNIRDNIDKLLISYQKPHGAISSSTISKWIKSTLSKAGIDTTIFKAHSTRSASSSSVMDKGVPVNIILNACGWSKAETFAKFYKKDIVQSSFANEILSLTCD